MAYGNDGGLVLVDIVQKSVLLSMASVDLYSSADPYTRLPRSPKRLTDSAINRADLDDHSCRSPSCDQVGHDSRDARHFLIFFFRAARVCFVLFVFLGRVICDGTCRDRRRKKKKANFIYIYIYTVYTPVPG